MQLGLILGIVFAIGATVFALQNNTPVTVSVATWTLEGSLALVLLVAMGLGALIAGDKEQTPGA
jgi:lipopolysaccharide assembly protein A